MVDRLEYRWETSCRRAVPLLDIALPTPSLGCIEPQSTWQELHTLLTRPLRWAIKVDCQDTAWPSLLSHAKWQRNWLPTRSHSRQFHVLSSTAWAGTAKTPSKAHGFSTMSWTELQYRWEHRVGGQCHCLTLLYRHRVLAVFWMLFVMFGNTIGNWILYKKI